MEKFRTTGLLALGATLAVALLLLPCWAAEEAETKAFAPTGDALWDAYAPALLDALDDAGPGELPHVAPEKLDALEARFAGDPRYWQLRWWESRSAGEPDELLGTTGPTRWLREARQRGTVDAATLWLLAERDEAELNRMWELYGTADLPPEYAARIPQFKPEDTPEHWYEQQRFAACDALVAALPGESAAWYRRAMLRFEYGEWDGALADLTAGNAAPSNCALLPFPWSFVQQRMAGGLPVGSELAAGIVATAAFDLPLPNFIRIKDHAKEQVLRWGMGAPLSEIGPWHGYACRMGSMEGGVAINWLVAIVIDNMLTKYVLVDSPEALDSGQRDELWTLHHRVYNVKEIVRYELDLAQPDETENLTAELASQDITAGDIATLLMALNTPDTDYAEFVQKLADRDVPVPSSADLAQMGQEGLQDQLDETLSAIQTAQYRTTYKRLLPEYGEIYLKVKERFDGAERFDFTTWSMPPAPEPDPATAPTAAE